MHLVLRSSMAKGSNSFLMHRREVDRTVRQLGRKFGVKVYRLANAGNHLHLIILPRSRTAYLGFIRSITGLLPRIVMGIQKGNPLGVSFWDKRPFTRIIEWGQDFQNVCSYLLQNTLEALGFVPYSRKFRIRV